METLQLLDLGYVQQEMFFAASMSWGPTPESATSPCVLLHMSSQVHRHTQVLSEMETILSCDPEQVLRPLNALSEVTQELNSIGFAWLSRKAK